MKPPPSDPPKPAASSEENWEDEALGDQRASGMTVEAARKLLSVNPALREKGADTNFIIKQSQGGAAAAGDAKLTKPVDKESKEGVLATAKDADHLLDLATQNYQQEKRTLESEISMLQAKLAGMKTRYCKAVMDKMAVIDRNLTSPMTQAALQQHRGIVNELGFTPQKFMEHLRQKR